MKSISILRMKNMVLVFAVALFGAFVFSLSVSADVGDMDSYLKGNDGYYITSKKYYHKNDSEWAFSSGEKYTYDKYRYIKTSRYIIVGIPKGTLNRYDNTYNKKGKIIESKLNNVKYIYTYNKKGRLAKESIYSNTNGAWTLVEKTDYKYDKKGNLINKKIFDMRETDSYEEYSYTYKKGVKVSGKIVQHNWHGTQKEISKISYYQSGYRKGWMKKETTTYNGRKSYTTYTYKPDKTGKNVGTCIWKHVDSVGNKSESKTVYTWKKIK